MNDSTPVQDAILLVAGTGTRLRPLTDTQPKCLLEVGGQSLLLRLLRQLGALGIERVVLATGYLSSTLADAVEGVEGLPEIVFAHNADYQTTNNAESLKIAMPAVEGRAFLLCDGDVLLREAGWLGELVREPRENVLSMIAREDLGEEEMKIKLVDGAVAGLSKKLAPQASHGESLGLQKLGVSIAADLSARLAAMSEAERATSYYEDIFAELIVGGHTFHTLSVPIDTWTEIDTIEDLEAARALFLRWSC
ncbi:MAG: NTP transferase domain-containing protein [Bradymonadaceae bacterium]|nr:NTP transferase domain-containing protein [Lujinxingiaceae bacterium]